MPLEPSGPAEGDGAWLRPRLCSWAPPAWSPGLVSWMPQSRPRRQHYCHGVDDQREPREVTLLAEAAHPSSRAGLLFWICFTEDLSHLTPALVFLSQFISSFTWVHREWSHVHTSLEQRPCHSPWDSGRDAGPISTGPGRRSASARLALVRARCPCGGLAAASSTHFSRSCPCPRPFVPM